MRTWLATLAVLLGCSRNSTTSGSDPLWGLVPAGARGAIVISPRGVGMIEAGYRQIRSTFDSVPDFAPAKAWLDEQLAPVGGANISLAEFGFGASKGAALFLMKDGMVAILPVVDRDKFLAKVKGTKGPNGEVDTIVDTKCKIVRGFYACATSEAMLATLGQGDLKKHLGEARAHGEIEIVGAELPFSDPPMIVAAAIQLARGGGTLRGTVINAPPQIADRFAKAVTLANVDTQRTAGFTLIDLTAWLPKTEEVLVGDVTVGNVLSTFDGAMSVVTPAGDSTMHVEQALTDPAPMKTVVERCTEVPGAEMLQAKVENGVCHFKAPNWDIALDLWIDDKTLRIGKQTGAAAAKTIPMTPIGAELARGAWALAFWGRGTMLATPELKGAEAVDVPPESALVIRVMSLVNEIGFGARKQGDRLEIVASARTLFANPDAVLQKIFAISANDIAATRSVMLAAPVARSAPSSPFAHDFAAGHAGLLVPIALVGSGVSLVVPALMLMRQTPIPDETPAP